MKPLHSMILDEAERWLFRVILLVSLYFTVRGHNAPGGGFIGGLVAGAAFTLRHLTGLSSEEDLCGRLRPTMLLGLGALVAIVTAMVPLFVGDTLLESAVWSGDLPIVGEFKVVSAAIFDTGVYLVVLGVILTILLALGGTEDTTDGDNGEDTSDSRGVVS
jgi:multisubunit Na+/H+ antiporter MnhB subunit